MTCPGAKEGQARFYIVVTNHHAVACSVPGNRNDRGLRPESHGKIHQGEGDWEGELRRRVPGPWDAQRRKAVRGEGASVL